MAARVSLNAVVLPSAPATAARAPLELTVTETTFDTAEAGRAQASEPALTEVTTPARLQVSAATVTVLLLACVVTAPPVNRPLGRTTGV